MPFGLAIATERAAALQQSIQDELTKRGYSPDADPVMAEYITIMIINNKTAGQITSELEDLIGSDFDPTFTDWLFTEAAKGATDTESPAQAQPTASEQPPQPVPVHDPSPQPSGDTPSRRQSAPRNGVYQQAISQALPFVVSTSQKRPASARSPSPNHPNKIRRTEVPTGPRAMARSDGERGPSTSSNTRSLLDRVGPMRNNHNSSNNNNGNFATHDDIQARIDNIVGNSSADQMMMMNGGMDMNTIGMNNPMMLQEMMMNQMALMAQMASSMGIINPNTGQFGGPPFGVGGDMGMFPGGMNGFPGQPQMGGGMNMNMNGGGRGRGASRGRGAGRGRGAPPSNSLPAPEVLSTSAEPNAPVLHIAVPTPSSASTASALTTSSQAQPQRTGYVVPERPQSPTLCKFGLKCTNSHCRYSHPSPVATPESGVVLSNEACDKGKDCKDKDCIKAHVSPAVLNPQATEQTPVVAHPHPHHAAHQPTHSPIPCRFGASCTRPDCSFTHPPSRQHSHSAAASSTPCRYGSACTRAACTYQHPEDRVLPSSFHRGLSSTGGLITVPTPEAGTMGALSETKLKNGLTASAMASPHRSVTFNQSSIGAGVKEKLERQMREIEEKKTEAEKAVRDAEEKKREKEKAAPVAITA